jgi:hypothetical protein
MNTTSLVLYANLVSVAVVVLVIVWAVFYIRRKVEDNTAQNAEILDVVTDIREYKRTQVDVWKKAMEAHARGELEGHLKNVETMNPHDEETKRG